MLKALRGGNQNETLAAEPPVRTKPCQLKQLSRVCFRRCSIGISFRTATDVQAHAGCFGIFVILSNRFGRSAEKMAWAFRAALARQPREPRCGKVHALRKISGIPTGASFVSLPNRMSFLRPNLATKGRIIRAIAALVMAVAAFFTWPHSRTAGIALAVSALFVGFESARGWCVLRACGVKTKF